jgi:pimeloyl-ACP methyl ester carboxylesterase
MIFLRKCLNLIWVFPLAVLVSCQSGSTAASQQARDCKALMGAEIGADQIALPTSGAEVSGVRILGALQSSPSDAVVHCRVSGLIRPVDPSAPNIEFEVLLPMPWNGKALMLGGGGYNGVISDMSAFMFSDPNGGIPSPLERGFAIFASDSGHQANARLAPIPAVDASFMLNEEALHNYAGQAIKKTRDSATFLIETFYQRQIEKTYIAGGSNGGREVLLAISNWPNDFDGAIAAYPFWNNGTTTLAFGAAMKGFMGSGSYPSPAQQTLLYNSVIAACDFSDGLRDQLISKPSGCNFDINDLKCENESANEHCLSREQLDALKNYASAKTFRLNSDVSHKEHPGFPIFTGADLRGAQQLGSAPPTHPASVQMPIIAHFFEQFVRYGVLSDADANPWDADVLSSIGFQNRVSELVGLLNVPPSELSGFRENGGRLIIVQGLADPIVSPDSTSAFWTEMISLVGENELSEFARYYTIPGYGHGPGGTNAFEPAWDVLEALDDWVQDGNAPVDPAVVDTSSDNRRERPLCEIGTYAKYVSGNPNLATSFECASEN